MIDLPGLPLQEAAWIFATLMAVVLLAPILSERVRVPAVVGLVLAGVVVGEYGLGLLERAGPVEVLGAIGLLYLMFVAGLELDLDDFLTNRVPSLVFGLATFVVPFSIGIIVALALGMGPLPSVLIGSAWASHTLVAYPIYRRFGTFRNRAVAVTVGATIITDTAALLVLAVVAGASQDQLDVGFWAGLVASMAVLGFVAFWMLPRLARWFFTGLGQDRSVRFLFVLTAAFALSGVAEAAGIEGIVGAFFAGLALNRLVPNGSLVMERIEFVGSNLFIPLFLISVGMLIDPAVATDVSVLGLAGAFIAVALGAKALAAVAVGVGFRYERAEIWSMFALSSAQAAATLAAVIVGLELGLFDITIVNAVVLVILVTCLVASAAASRWAPRLPLPPAKRALGTSVVVPVARPSSAAPLVQLAATFAKRDGGFVIPLTVVPPDADKTVVATTRDLIRQAESSVLAAGAEAAGVVRIDASPAAGILHTVVEHDASLMVLGWKGHTGRREALFGSTIDTILGKVAVPTIIARLPQGPLAPARVVLALSEPAAGPGLSSLEIALECVARLADNRKSVVVRTAGLTEELHNRIVAVLGRTVVVEEARRHELLRDVDGPDTLVVAPIRPDWTGLHGAVERIARQIPTSPFLATLGTALGRAPDGIAPPTATGLLTPLDPPGLQ